MSRRVGAYDVGPHGWASNRLTGPVKRSGLPPLWRLDGVMVLRPRERAGSDLIGA